MSILFLSYRVVQKGKMLSNKRSKLTLASFSVICFVTPYVKIIHSFNPCPIQSKEPGFLPHDHFVSLIQGGQKRWNLIEYVHHITIRIYRFYIAQFKKKRRLKQTYSCIFFHYLFHHIRKRIYIINTYPRKDITPRMLSKWLPKMGFLFFDHPVLYASICCMLASVKIHRCKMGFSISHICYTILILYIALFSQTNP